MTRISLCLVAGVASILAALYPATGHSSSIAVSTHATACIGIGEPADNVADCQELDSSLTVSTGPLVRGVSASRLGANPPAASATAYGRLDYGVFQGYAAAHARGLQLGLGAGAGATVNGETVDTIRITPINAALNGTTVFVRAHVNVSGDLSATSAYNRLAEWSITAHTSAFPQPLGASGMVGFNGSGYDDIPNLGPDRVVVFKVVLGQDTDLVIDYHLFATGNVGHGAPDGDSHEIADLASTILWGGIFDVDPGNTATNIPFTLTSTSGFNWASAALEPGPLADPTVPGPDDTPPATDDTPPATDDTPPSNDDTPPSTAVPAPPSLLLAALGLGILGWGARRLRRSA